MTVCLVFVSEVLPFFIASLWKRIERQTKREQAEDGIFISLPPQKETRLKQFHLNECLLHSIVHFLRHLIPENLMCIIPCDLEDTIQEVNLLSSTSRSEDKEFAVGCSCELKTSCRRTRRREADNTLVTTRRWGQNHKTRYIISRNQNQSNYFSHGSSLIREPRVKMEYECQTVKTCHQKQNQTKSFKYSLQDFDTSNLSFMNSVGYIYCSSLNSCHAFLSNIREKLES